MLGFVLLLMAVGWYLFNAFEDKNAGQKATEILSKLEDASNNSDDASIIALGDDTFCGKIIIDKIKVELPVYDVWDEACLKAAPCRYSGNISTNDMIIAAHNYKSHFGKLSKVQIGDSIIFIDAYGVSHFYKVNEISVLDGTAVSDMYSGGWDLTLFTCTKGGEQRITVRCVRQG